MMKIRLFAALLFLTDEVLKLTQYYRSSVSLSFCGGLLQPGEEKTVQRHINTQKDIITWETP